MKARKQIVLYGNSVILGTIAASLIRSADYEVVTLRLADEKDRDGAALRPDILLFDSEATRAEEVVSFLQSNPAMLLVGINPDINQVKVWSIRELQEVSLQDLMQVIAL